MSVISRAAKLTALAAVAIATFLGGARAAPITQSATVLGTAGPWDYSTTLNSTFQYGVGDQTAPTTISSGFDFSAGNTFTVQYVSGTVSAGTLFPSVDANGDTSYIFNNSPGSSGKVAPSAYMNPATYPIYLVELVGTFADSTGAIVGTPFALGNGPTDIIAPAGATELLLGINDDIYSDNTGSFLVDVTGPGAAIPPSVPEPGSLVLLGTSLGLLAAFGLQRRAS